MNFTLRPLTINDLGSLMKYADNPKIADNLTNIFPNPYTEESGRWFIKFATSHDPKHIMAIDIKGEFVGEKCRIRLLARRTILGQRHHDQSH